VGASSTDKEIHHMNRVFASILLVVVLVVGGGVIATAAYQAGVSNAVTTTTQNGSTTAVAPVVVPAYGYGVGFWHPFGWIFGFFATIFFLFIVFALIRAIFFRGGPGRRGGWGPGWGDGWDAPGRDRRDRFDDWHRKAHGTGGNTAGDANPTDMTSRTQTPPSGPYAPS
jgi:hypothetical protein